MSIYLTSHNGAEKMKRAKEMNVRPVARAILANKLAAGRVGPKCKVFLV